MNKRFVIILMIPLFGLSNNKDMFEFRTHPSEKDSLSIEYNQTKRFSTGIKFGTPYMAVLGAQYILPFFNNHFAPYFDYSQYSYEKNNENAQFRFSEWGISYFFKERGKGIYMGLSRSNLSYEVDYMNVALENGSKGSGNGKVDMRTTNLRLGLKSGGGIYFKIEMGYGFGDIPDSVNFRAFDNYDSSYSEPSSNVIPKINGTSGSGMFVGNIGFGLAF